MFGESLLLGILVFILMVLVAIIGRIIKREIDEIEFRLAGINPKTM
jgi:hypothetical protein